MGISVIGGATSGGATGTQNAAFEITNGYCFVENEFLAGHYYVQLLGDNGATFSAPKIDFYNSVNELIATISLTVSASDPRLYWSLAILNEPATAMKLYSNSTSRGLVTLESTLAVKPKQIVKIASTTSGYNLTFNARAYVFGGGGSAGIFQTGGGGSGYLATAVFAPGTYNAVIGAGGPGGWQSSGGPGGASSFGTLTANGGLQPTGTDGATGGAGGSGGGAGALGTAADWAMGGSNGANGGSTPFVSGGVGSGVAAPLLTPTPTLSTGPRGTGTFYCGGNGAANNTIGSGGSAGANSASGGGGTATLNQTNQVSGGAGGSGVIFLVEEPA